MNHLSGFCMHIRYFSPIVFQNNALTFVSQWTKEGSLLGATAFAAVPTRGGHLIPYGPPTVSCKHGWVSGLLAAIISANHSLSSGFESNVIRFCHPLTLPAEVIY